MNKPVILFSTILCILFTSLAVIQAQENEEQYAIIAEYTFDEKNVDAAIELLLELQALTLENEEGCIIYDVLLSEEDRRKIFVYECYENEAAFKIHTNSIYFKTIVSAKLTPLVKDSKKTKVIPLNNSGNIGNEEM